MKIRTYMMSSLILGFAMLSPQVYADTNSSLQQSLDNANQTLQHSVDQKSALQSQLDESQSSLDQIAKEMKDNSTRLDTLTKKANQVNTQITDQEAKLKELQTIFGQQLDVMYEKGSVDYLTVLLNSTSFSDFLSRFDLIRMIASHNEDVMKEIKSLKLSLEQQKQQLQSDTNTIQQKQQELAILKQTSEALQTQRQHEMAAVQSSINSEQKTVDYFQEQVNFAQQEAAMNQQQPIADTSAHQLSGRGMGLTSASSSQILSIATRYTGVPYVWGGTSPSGFDCSGFTQYVFGQAGIGLNRTAAGQFSQGISISQGNLQPGDLVFFSTYGPGATHVGIYMGSGLFINAEDSGVRVSSLSNSYWGPRYIGAKRIG